MPVAVLQTNLNRPSIEQLKRAFAHVPGLTAADAYILGQDAYGVLVKDFSTEQAIAMQRALRSEGIETEIVDHGLLPPIPPSKHVQRFDITPEHLVIYDPLNRTFALEWKHITMISAGAVKLSEFVTMREPSPLDSFDVVSGPVAFRVVQPSTETREIRAGHLLADFIVAGGSLRYSMVADKFNFLGLGDRRTRDVDINFVTFMAAALQCAPHAVLNSGAEALQEGRVAHFPTKNAYLEEMVWRLWQMKRNA